METGKYIDIHASYFVKTGEQANLKEIMSAKRAFTTNGSQDVTLTIVEDPSDGIKSYTVAGRVPAQNCGRVNGLLHAKYPSGAGVDQVF